MMAVTRFRQGGCKPFPEGTGGRLLLAPVDFLETSRRACPEGAQENGKAFSRATIDRLAKGYAMLCCPVAFLPDHRNICSAVGLGQTSAGVHAGRFGRRPTRRRVVAVPRRQFGKHAPGRCVNSQPRTAALHLVCGPAVGLTGPRTSLFFEARLLIIGW